MTSTMIIILIILFILTGLFFWFKSKKKSPEKSISSKPQPVASTNKLSQSLLKINIKVRIESLPHLAIIEAIIDKLLAVIPKMQKEIPDKEITWQTEKIASTYLKDLIESFITLDSNRRKNSDKEFLSSLESLQIEISNIENLMGNSQMADFEMKTAEIGVRFSNLLKQ